jgi:hypothetical protein
VTTMAAPTTSIATHEVTWRDAVTPLSRASRRRWTACYGVLLILLAATEVDDRFTVSANHNHVLPFILLVALPVVFGMLRRGTRRIAALDHPNLDERDIAARDAAYRIAFPLLVIVALAALVLLGLAAPSIDRPGPGSSSTPGTFVEAGAFIGLGVWIALWAVFLPTGALAWREPDALDSELGGPGMPESVRDAILGFIILGGFTADVLTDVNMSFVVLGVSLALVGGLARRASGQSMMSRRRKWRVAIGLALIAIIAVWAIVATGGG